MKRPSSLVRRGWSRGTYTRDKAGTPVHYLSKEAVAFSLAGAILTAKVPMNFWEAVRSRIAQIDGSSRTSDLWNDAPGRTQAEGVALLKSVEALPKFAGLWEDERRSP